MSRILKLFIIALAFCILTTASVSAQSESQENLVGKWQLEIEKTKELLAGTDELADFQVRLEAGLSELIIEFKADGKAALNIEMGGNEMTMDGSWKLKSSDDKGKCSAAIEFDNESKDVVLTFQDDNTIKFEIPDEPSNIFIRVNDDDSEVEMEKSDKVFVGSWKPNLEKTKALMAESGENEQSIKGNLEELSRMTIDFNDSFEFQLNKERGGESTGGTWKVSEEGDDQKEFSLACEMEGREINVKIKMLSQDSMQIQPGSETPAVFDRVKKAESESNSSDDQ